MLTEQEDHELRRYARWLNPELGEDAYHTAVCDVLARGQAGTITNVQAFFRVAIKRALIKLIRHLQVDFIQTSAWLFDDRPTMWPDKQTHCKRGHAFTPENLKYKGNVRMCRTCVRMMDAASARKRRRTHAPQEAQYA